MERLSWNEIRARAAQFAREWQDAHYEKGQTQTFYNEFFQIFGVTRKRVASFEEPVKKLGDKQGFIDLIWKGLLIVEQKSAGRDLSKAKGQAFDYFPGLSEEELPRFVLACDFQNFELHALESGEVFRFKLSDLPKQVHHFGFILGLERRTFREQDPVNVKASYLMGELHDALKASGYKGHDLEVFLVRLLFCLFADDTGIFEPRGIFLEFVRTRTREDGSDVGARLIELFQVLNEPRESRQTTLDEDLQAFDYINGDLFREAIRTPHFDAKMRKRLLDACVFDWSAISPAIFGALFQSVMDDDQRRRQGAHYTTERNILKVIEPLFLDDLRARFAKMARQRGPGKRKALESFQRELASLRFFDPACGCGNFLVIAYREIRNLEMDVLKELREGGQLVPVIQDLLRVNVHQFYGLEIDEFPVRIAQVALWMMDHIMNNEASMEFAQEVRRIPIGSAPNIVNADALETDWESVLPATECHYLFGNPPFGGSKYQSAMQRAQVQRIAQLGNSGGTLDYVCPWFIKAGQYLQKGTAKVGFVATNSITQGEQVAQLWPVLFERHNLEIAYAHRTFAWGSDARGKAHVHVVIIGLVRRDREPETKRLFSYPDIQGDPIETEHDKLSPYLIDASRLANPHMVVREVSKPINGAPEIKSGSQPIDDGNYLFTRAQRDAFLQAEPNAEVYFRPYVGSEELLNGLQRWILCLVGAEPAALRKLPAVLARMEAVCVFRRKSKRESTLAISDQPTRLNVEVIPDRPFLAIPKVSSERRDYAPIAYLSPPTVPSDLVFVMPDADLWHFGILTSRMHMAWLRNIGGKLKSDYRYSIGIVYNNFPWPNGDEPRKQRIRELAQAVLDARAAHPGSTLADLYDPLTMPPDLRKAHQTLDRAVDSLYSSDPFPSDLDRVEFLLARYEDLITPMAAAMRPDLPRRKRRVKARTSVPG
ncbi:MAG: N-6 DNA methylase [Fimbriimonadaceae bacterium]|nr:N-6 DNA methylase [Fimbriimonadaceae bacterium]NUM38560.1 class I SAM-dependent DNA methyltransferase [Armatimonadota bacterium]